MSRVLIISHDLVAERMAGPAIRSWEFARALSASNQVTLAIPNRTDLAPPSEFTLVQFDRENLVRLASSQEAIVVFGHTLAAHPALKTLGVPLVVDIYDPFVLENLQYLAGHNLSFQKHDHAGVLAVLLDQLWHGDFFLCANERQRDYWLGWLTALNRVNPLTYADDPTLRRLIAVVPFGVPADPPRRTRPVLKGVHPGIGPDDRVLLWGGGVYNWFDPLTLIRAMADVAARRNDVRLFFLGIQHPNPQIRGFEMRDAAVALSRELGLYDRYVFFNDWVAYDDRQNYLLEADLGVSLHLNHVETSYSFRTRLLDYLWAGLPMVITQGDALADLVRDEELGRVVDYEAVDQVVTAILELLDTPDLRETCRPRFARATGRLTWPQAVRPLLDFCRAPRRAADRREGTEEPPPWGERLTVPASSWSARLRKGWRVYQDQGAAALWREVQGYLRWRGLIR